MLKLCKSCNLNKALEEYSKNKALKDGFNIYCKNCCKIKHAEYRKLNKTALSTKRKLRYNPEKARQYYLSKRVLKGYRKADPVQVKLRKRLRKRIKNVLKGNPKSLSLTKSLGCTYKELKLYLESLFQPGMTWQNYGKWHIDHIRPCASFDLSKPEEQLKCFHFSNLQPLWAEENLSKGKRREKSHGISK